VTVIQETAGSAQTSGSSGEIVTHSFVRDVVLPSGRTLALVTLQNNSLRPNTFGPISLAELGSVLDELAARAAAGAIQAVAVTGKPGMLAAGADLTVINGLGSAERVREFAELGHRTLGRLAELPVPSFCFINGAALGGGLELALHAGYRTVSASAGPLGLPEVSLGLIPGWGGAFLLPNLIGINRALDVVIWNPLRQNRLLTAYQAAEHGIADAVFPSVRFLEDSLQWADAVLDGEVIVDRGDRPDALTRIDDWPAAIDVAGLSLEDRIGRVPQAPWAALDLLSAAMDGDRNAGFIREDRAIAAVATGDQFAASAYAFDLIRQRGRRPVGAPDASLSRPITKVGVIGAGLMARQFALLFLRRLHIPVLIADLDQDRVDAAVVAIGAELEKQQQAGRIGVDETNRLRALIQGTTDLTDYADCDLVIEAVFEDLSVKHQVLGAVEQVVGPNTVLATNTSSLSVEHIGTALTYPERLVGIHFFNPVAVMPLVEIVRTRHTSDAAVATAFSLAKALGKSAVLTADAPGFVVNRLLAVVMGEAVRAVDAGTALSTVEDAFAPLCLPMTPFALIDLAGWKVVAHVLDTMAAAFPDRFYATQTLHRLAALDRVLERNARKQIMGWSTNAQTVLAVGDSPATGEQILRRVEDGLTKEIALMLDEDVVPDAADIDMCMVLGAGWRHLNGGITPYLDRVGASERAFGGTFNHPPIVGIGASADDQSVTAGAS
jgi:3-hydroxyacyl-CoA dehydrogenase/enoyl-CoA hydratase/carnithine racemase